MTITATRKLVRSVAACRAATGHTEVMPRWLFEYLGVQPSNVEAVEVAGGQITVSLFQPLSDWDAFMRATSLLGDTVERIRIDFGLASEDIVLALRTVAANEEWMHRVVQRWVADRQGRERGLPKVQKENADA
jgi:hypothetical protein